MNSIFAKIQNNVSGFLTATVLYYLRSSINKYLASECTYIYTYYFITCIMTYCSCSKTSASYALLESAMIKFLSRCCWCHLANQKLLAKLLIEVISQQRTTSSKCIVVYQVSFV